MLSTDLIPLLIVPLLKVNGLGGKYLDWLLIFIQQLNTDVVLAATVPSWRIPKVTQTHTSMCIQIRSHQLGSTLFTGTHIPTCYQYVLF